VEGQSIIIIKRVKKVTQSGAHGGSWKVAYADFVTAMMAFFLLLWLITMIAPEKRARVANYFKNFSVFDKSGNTVVESFRATSIGLIVGDEGERPGGPAEANDNPVNDVEGAPEKQLKQELEAKLEQELGDQKDQVMIQTFEGGVRIEVIDSESNPMFPRGRSELTPEGKKVLKVISEDLIARGSKIALEGHTDAFNYLSKQYSNWELSTERASAARRELESNGLPAERLLRVAGFAATEPLIKENAYDPRNRRISIMVFDQQPRLVSASAKNQPVQLSSNQTNQPVQVAPERPQNNPIDPVQQYLFNR
jgi:chemotaxis protein MotB